MPTIVKHVDKKTGKTRVFESTPHYDPVTKQSRPIRRYLGTLDPETGELIPSCGRKGRTKSRKDLPTDEQNAEVARLQKAISKKDGEIIALKSEVTRLKQVIRTFGKVCDAIRSDLVKAPAVDD